VSAAGPRILPVGDAALTLELGREFDPALNARVRAIDRALRAAPFPGLLETVPAYSSLLAVYDPTRCRFDEARAALARLVDTAVAPTSEGRTHVLPTVYGGEHGPDLAEVAHRGGLSEADVIARHAAGEYTALLVGFLPGFAYLGELDPALDTPRRATPRPRVPAGSVAIAGRQTGVYPFASPGGWNLIGRTAEVLFDAQGERPALIEPGDHVRFARVEALPTRAPAAPVSPARAPAIEVLDGGLLTTVQDTGRRGHRRLGVPWCGALDGEALAAANLALGNPRDAAGLECTAAGPTLRFLATTRFALTGADLGAVLERADLGTWPVPLGRAVVARPGNILSLRERRVGLRAYLAFAGGLDVPAVLGSRATDLVAGFGGYQGRALHAGDTLALGHASTPPAEAAPQVATQPSGPLVLRVVRGPQDDRFTAEACARLERESYEVGPLSDRTACRLQGAPLEHDGPGEILTDGMVPGCVQVPPDGRPIVMLADGPTTGGYPKIATVITADLARLAQLLPGDRLRLQAVTVEQAQRVRA
jgi:KipI family sensor histidine kinase inhibitor